MMSSDVPYMLRADGRHEQDVKWVTSTPDSSIITASRDMTSKRWRAPPQGDDLCLLSHFVGHTHFVNFVLFAEAVGCIGGKSAAITGSHDKSILLWDAEAGTVEAVLLGHDDVVKCGALIHKGSSLVTGSWDNRCIVWDLNLGQLVRRVSIHSNNVTSVVAFGETEVLSTSGDRTVVHWVPATGVVLGTYKAHSDTVQCAVSLLSSTLFMTAFGGDAGLFASCGNDGRILVWSTGTPGGAPVASFAGHESIVYHLVCHPVTGELVSSGDDHTVRVWNPSGCVQCIFHPDLVWCASGLADSTDIITACADGFVRLWTRDVSCIATPEKIELLENLVAATRIPAKLALDGSDPSAIPHKEAAIRATGSFEGQRILARDGDHIHVLAWGQGRWDKVGFVVKGEADDGTGATKPTKREKQHYCGAMFDYLLDVDIAGTTVKLPYNRGESVFDAAQQFINDNADIGVSQADKELIVNHIINSIDTEDAALVGCPVTGAASKNNNTAAFSDFAKELAELEAHGKAGNLVSYRDEYKRLVDEGGDVNFSTFAQEEAEARRAAASGAAAPPPPRATVNPFDAAATNAVKDADLFSGFTASAAENKLIEFGISSVEAKSVTVAVANATTPPGPSVTEAIGTVSSWLSAQRLNRGQWFPVVDMFRALTVSSPDALSGCDAALSALLVDCLSANASDAERLVALRCVANLFACAIVGSHAASLHVCENVADERLLTVMREAVTKAAARGASNTMKVAAQRAISAMALFFAHAAQGRTTLVDLTVLGKCVISSVGIFMVIETDNAVLRPLVRAALLIVGSTNDTTDARRAVRPWAFKELFNLARAKKEFGDPDVVSGCRHIYSALLPLCEMGA